MEIVNSYDSSGGQYLNSPLPAKVTTNLIRMERNDVKKSCEIGHKCIRDDAIFLQVEASLVVDPQNKGSFKNRDMRGSQCYGISLIRVIISYSMCVDYKWTF